MTQEDPARRPFGSGARTSASGTPVAVDVFRDRQARRTWVELLAGPVIWFTHFMLVYLVAEAGCTGGGEGLRALNPPVPEVVTLVATAIAAVACLAFARRSYRRARGDDGLDLDRADGAGAVDEDDRGRRSLAFVGFLLSILSLVTILLVGVPAAYLTGC